jgi:diadenosine tetraphosphate (Ap4A) HIT family hydrolase
MLNYASGGNSGATMRDSTHNLNAHVCRFCQLSEADPLFDGAPFNRIRWQNPNVLVLPSKGALLANWWLVVPRAHSLCSLDMENNARDELMQVVGMLADELECETKSVPTIFENCPIEDGGSGSCGINHTHIHVIATVGGLVSRMRDELGVDFRRSRTDEQIAERRSGGASPSAWFIEAGDRQTISLPSNSRQYVRQQIAKLVGLSDKWHYDEFPAPANWP